MTKNTNNTNPTTNNTNVEAICQQIRNAKAEATRVAKRWARGVNEQFVPIVEEAENTMTELEDHITVLVKDLRKATPHADELIESLFPREEINFYRDTLMVVSNIGHIECQMAHLADCLDEFEEHSYEWNVLSQGLWDLEDALDACKEFIACTKQPDTLVRNKRMYDLLQIMSISMNRYLNADIENSILKENQDLEETEGSKAIEAILFDALDAMKDGEYEEFAITTGDIVFKQISMEIEKMKNNLKIPEVIKLTRETVKVDGQEFEVCPRCNGTGTYQKPTSIARLEVREGQQYVNPWCFKCDGVGHLDPNNKENIVEHDYTDLLSMDEDELKKLQLFLDSDDDPDFWAKLENVKLALSREAGQPEHELYRHDESPELSNRTDLSYEDIAILDAYYSIKRRRDAHPAQKIWTDLKAMRQRALDKAISLTEWVMLPLTAYDAKLDTRLAVLEARGEEPTEEQWNQAMAIRKRIANQCERYYEDRRTGEMKVDYRGYQGHTRRVQFNTELYAAWQEFYRCKELCANFWTYDEGIDLNTLNECVKLAWEQVVDANLADKRGKYFYLRHTEFNLWDVHGEVDVSCDQPTVKDEDRKGDIDPALWYQIMGVPTDDELQFLQYHGDTNIIVPEDSFEGAIICTLWDRW